MVAFLEKPQQIYWQTYQQTINTITETQDTGKPERPNQTVNDNYAPQTQKHKRGLKEEKWM